MRIRNPFLGQIQGIRKRTLQVGTFLIGMGAFLFFSSGDLGWAAAWLFLGLFTGVVGATAFVLAYSNPGLVKMRAEKHRDSKRWDRILARMVALFAWVIACKLRPNDKRDRP